VAIDTGYSVVEMVLEDTSLPAEQTLREGARMVELYWKQILAEANPPWSEPTERGPTERGPTERGPTERG